MNRKSEHGNVLFFILIAVVLFGALSLTVGKMLTGGSPQMVSAEKSKVLADEIVGYAALVRRTVQDLKITNGCEDDEISFENDVVSGYEHVPPARDECKVFHADGGGIQYFVPQESWLDGVNTGQPLYGEWFFNGKTCIRFLGTGENDCEANGEGGDEELAIFLPYIKDGLCIAINKKLGANLPDGTPTVDLFNTAWMDKFDGVYEDGGELDIPALGKLEQCLEEGDNNALDTFGVIGAKFYAKILIAR